VAVGAPSSGNAAGQPSGSLSLEDDGSSTGEGDSTPAVLEMRAFTNPRTEADVLPSAYSYRLGSMSCTDWLRTHDACFGDDIDGQSHLLLSGLGETNASLHAWPMASGGVCWAWGAGSGLCAQHFPAEDRAAVTGIDPDAMGAGTPGTIVGVVPDDVVAARVTVHGIDHDALVQNNGLFYEFPDGADTCRALDSVTISYRDGSSDTIPDEMIGFGWISDPPDADTQPARDNADGLDVEPTAPPPDPDPPPRC
jgi:hypothetical protein